ncbi:TPA: hypothetical protein SMF55_001052 [Serratia liquefaciens]|nr:hypothetical protein [Serratia liquefaciens]
MKNNLVNQDIKTDKLDFSIRNNSEAWLTIPADGGQITFTGNADDAAKEFFNARIRERDGYISALKAERDALAVENAAMREAIAFATAPDMWIEQHDGMLDYRYSEWYVDVLNAAIETPATDAALAAIEARGVDKFSDFLGKQYQCEKANTAKGKAYKHVVFLACRFARELQEAK